MKVLEVKKSIWKRRVRKDTHQETVESYNRVERRFCAKKGEDVFIVERRERGSIGLCGRPAEKGIYLSL